MDSSDSEPDTGLKTPRNEQFQHHLQPKDGENQAVSSKLVEAALILFTIPLACRNHSIRNEYFDILVTWGGLSTVTLFVFFVVYRFSHIILYKIVLPVVVALTASPECLPLNVLVTLTALPIPGLLLPPLVSLVRHQLPPDAVLSCWWIQLLISELCTVITWLCDGSLTDTEVWLFASLAINVILVQGDPIGSLIQSLILACFLTFVPLIPLFESVIQISRLVGPHRRSRRAERIKLVAARKIYILTPIIGLFVLSTILYTHELSIVDLYFYIHTQQHLKMLGYWFGLLAVAIPFVLFTSKSWTLDFRRKAWHGCIVLMFLPVGSNLDPEFTALSVTIAFILFIILEIVRATGLPPFGVFIHRTLENFTDERDTCGPIVVSHIFLLLGIGIPIILSHSPAGIICLGLGDSSASIIGRHFGRLHLFGSKKTVEGTIAFTLGSITGMAACKYIIPRYDKFQTISFVDMLVTALATGLLEATSGMNDNVIVPIYMTVVLELFFLDN